MITKGQSRLGGKSSGDKVKFRKKKCKSWPSVRLPAPATGTHLPSHPSPVHWKELAHTRTHIREPSLNPVLIGPDTASLSPMRAPEPRGAQRPSGPFRGPLQRPSGAPAPRSALPADGRRRRSGSHRHEEGEKKATKSKSKTEACRAGAGRGLRKVQVHAVLT